MGLPDDSDDDLPLAQITNIMYKEKNNNYYYLCSMKSLVIYIKNKYYF